MLAGQCGSLVTAGSDRGQIIWLTINDNEPPGEAMLIPRTLAVPRSSKIARSSLWKGQPTHRPDHAGAERHEENENTEHSGGVLPVPLLDLKRKTAHSEDARGRVSL